MVPQIATGKTENLFDKAPLLWDNPQVACPCCDKTDRIAYDIKSDEYTCYHCGLVDCVGDFRARFFELYPAGVMPV